MSEMYPEKPHIPTELPPSGQHLSTGELVAMLDTHPVTRALGQSIVAALASAATALENAVTVVMRTPFDDLPEEVKNLPGFAGRHAEYNLRLAAVPSVEPVESAQHSQGELGLPSKRSRLARFAGAFCLGRGANKAAEGEDR